MFFAWIFDWLLTAEMTATAGHAHDHEHWISVVSGLILLALISSFAWKDLSRWVRNRSSIDSNLPKHEINIEGMTCGGCVDKLETAIRKSEGVDSVRIELQSGVATIVGQPKIEEIQRLIQSLGFQVAQSSAQQN